MVESFCMFIWLRLLLGFVLILLLLHWRMIVAVPSSIKKNKLAANKAKREEKGAKKMKAKALRAERKLKEKQRV
jgi:hypothetical protein